ncbi:hypothetical protein H8692_05650 [Mogibacterium sp. NSJ-24]|jgi:phage-related protein|uniref:Phage tail protein n=1 Tax=Lentihominibacter hominis TaxID=2763645 RepID=A0A926I9K0_9FIRM|nr:hypothetical protein [Lentihominibacter hominis]MBC8568248.1 hypothetical protein [Lentihominibacter hominis]
MADGKIIFETLLDESGLLKGLDDVEATAGQKLGVVGSVFEKTGGIMTKAFTGPIVAAGTAFMATAEKTREYRTEMGKLEAAFTTAGFSAEAAKGAYEDIYAVLGEEDTSVEAANHLAQLTDNEKELATWTGDILPGVFATFSDSLPLEGLTEAANETAKVGQVTGPLADALNWAGVSEDEFNKKLAACSTEQERQALITETLNDLYGDASDKYKELNGDVMDAHRAQAKLTDAIAKIGAVAEPIMTLLKDKAADLLTALAGLIEYIAAAPGWVQGLVLGFAGLLAAAGPLLVIFGKLATGLGNIMDFTSRVRASLVKKSAAMAADTVATTANTTATAANTTATNLATKAKSALSKVLTAGKWLLLGGAIVGVSALLLAFVKDSDAATAMVQNFSGKIVEMAGKFADMLPQIIEAISAALPTIINAGVEILTALLQGITQALPQIVAVIPQILNAIITAITENLPMLIEAAIQIIMALVQGLVQALPMLVAAIPQIITAIINAITTNLPMIINSAVQIIMALIQGFIQALPTLIAAIPQIITAIITGITQNLPAIISGAVQIIVALIQGLIQAIPQLIAALPQIIMAIVNGLISMLGQIFSVGVQILKKLWDGISSWVGSLGSKVVSFAKSLPGKIKSGIGSLVSVGKDWVKGLWNGIKNVTGWIVDKIKGFGRSCLNAIKDFFGIHSPSRVMDKIIGRNLVYGLADGITSQTKLAVKAARKQMMAVQDAYSAAELAITPDWKPPEARIYDARFSGGAAFAASAPAAPGAINQTVNIYQPVETPHETARAIKNIATFGLAGAGGVV